MLQSTDPKKLGKGPTGAPLKRGNRLDVEWVDRRRGLGWGEGGGGQRKTVLRGTTGWGCGHLCKRVET